MIGEFEEAMTTGTGLRVQEKGPHLDIFAKARREKMDAYLNF